MEDEVYDSVNDNVQYLWGHYRSRAWGHNPNSNPTVPVLARLAGTQPSGFGNHGGWRRRDVSRHIRDNLEGAGAAPCNPERVWDNRHIPLRLRLHQFEVAYFFVKPVVEAISSPIAFEEMST